MCTQYFHSIQLLALLSILSESVFLCYFLFKTLPIFFKVFCHSVSNSDWLYSLRQVTSCFWQLVVLLLITVLMNVIHTNHSITLAFESA